MLFLPSSSSVNHPLLLPSLLFTNPPSSQSLSSIISSNCSSLISESKQVNRGWEKSLKSLKDLKKKKDMGYFVFAGTHC